ncbi:Alpha/Beta hydrolase protein [Entophlyctis helioformis]|nr:Alpha/Beta hydrolase protein [Entophlyctis helioformis]
MLVPDHTDPETVLNFARFTYDAYYEPDDKAWTPVPGWNVTGRFGWRDGGIRGYLFIDETEEILVIVIKGTSLSTPIGSGPTAKLDKLNDNMMFSTSCLLRESNFDGSYYNLAQTIYLAVKEWFPKHTNIWMAGHSLGGALAALVALTNDLPSFSFESPGDLLFATRLGLVPDVVDPTEFLGSLPIYHFGNDGDPIFLGICTGVTSSCYWLEYALETKCHIGHECMYTEKMSKKMWPWSATASASASDQSKAAIGPAAVRDSARSQLHRLGNPHSLPSTHTLNDGKVDAEGSIQFHSIDFVIKRFLEPATSVPKCVTKPQCLKSECPTWSFVD